MITMRISSYEGLVPGAHHTHASLIDYDADRPKPEVDLEWPLTAKQAIEVNKRERALGLASKDYYKPGDTQRAFWSEADVKATALKVWKEHFPEGRLLLYGDNPLYPVPVLWCDDHKVWGIMRALHTETVECGGYEGDEEKMERIQKAWDSVMGRYRKRGRDGCV